MSPTNSCWTMGFIILKPPLTQLIVQCTTFGRTALAQPLVNYGSRWSGKNRMYVTLLLTLNAQMFSADLLLIEYDCVIKVNRFLKKALTFS